MTAVARLLLGSTSVCMLVTALAACAARMAPSSTSLAPPEPAAPALVRRPIDQALECFGTQLRAYTVVDERDLVIEIDWIVNDTGVDKELPTDANAYVLRAIDKIGKPLVAFAQSPVGQSAQPPPSTVSHGALNANPYGLPAGPTATNPNPNPNTDASSALPRSSGRWQYQPDQPETLPPPPTQSLPPATAAATTSTTEEPRKSIDAGEPN